VIALLLRLNHPKFFFSSFLTFSHAFLHLSFKFILG